ncbi:MAG: alpha/beta hydrolase [Bacillus sp. (in: Bacteria)]|nr:alpha/beta hydrolase [Bacillus sp. (in: firmicutes)]
MMHVYSKGDGEETIVLLPGLGVALPSADFGPLMRKLSEDYTVVTVEYFGVGFSDQIDTPRTNENYMNELRTALNKAGFMPPYILMPHSASGIYSEYYAITYPEEVTSIIMLDTTSTAYITEDLPPDFIHSLTKFQQAVGNPRILASLLPDTKLLENGYTEEEIDDYKLYSYHTVNDTMINQAKVLMENVKEVNGLPFPEEIPVLKLIAQETVEAMAEQDKDDGMGYQRDHLNRLGKNVSYQVLDATHFLYQTEIDEIVTLTNEF